MQVIRTLCCQLGQLLLQFGRVDGRLRLLLSPGQHRCQETGTTLLVHEPVQTLALAVAVLDRLALGALLVGLLLATRAAVAALVLRNAKTEN